MGKMAAGPDYFRRALGRESSASFAWELGMGFGVIAGWAGLPLEGIPDFFWGLMSLSSSSDR
jgi:hypothetical protein